MNKMPFKNYAGFKELFVRADGSRKNRILLEFLKSRSVRKFIAQDLYMSDWSLPYCMAGLRDYVISGVCHTRKDGPIINVMGTYLSTPNFESDANKGICDDGDVTCYRYINTTTNRIYKMRIGKMVRTGILHSEFGELLPESVVLWLCEEITRDWVAYAQAKNPEYKLVVDDDFEYIYNANSYAGRADFQSCMTNSDQHGFYANSVKAKAASIRDAEDKILARCIIYTHAYDEEGKRWRLAERQYSQYGDNVYKSILVYALISGGHIDAYKKVGADCHSPRAWMNTRHEPIEDARFNIECNLEANDILSYQDSFKWYDMDNHTAYNYDTVSYSHMLDTTDASLEGDNYDSYHDEYVHCDVITVYYNGREYTCAENAMDDFVYVDLEGEYFHYENVHRCPYCGDRFVDGYYSEITEEGYCCSDCADNAESRYKERNWHWSNLEGRYINPDYAVTLRNDDDDDIVSEDFAKTMVSNGEAIKIDGIYIAVNE